MDVDLFVPCYVDQLVPQVGLASVALLERLGCRVRYDARQTCCGQPFVTTGALAEAERLAKRHLGLFAKAEAIVCPSASCVATVRHRYAELVGAEPARALAARTFELGEFLVRVLNRTDVGASFPHRVALLESCHGLRELELGWPSERIARAPAAGITESLLRAVAGLELCEPARPDECCGFGGAFSVTHPELSSRIGRAKLAALAQSGAEFVTGTDASCLLHLDGLRRREGAGPRFVHLAEILAGEVAG